MIAAQFTSKERDAETGLDYFGARYLSSAMGRFTSPDPVVISPALVDPQSWSKYGYAFNRPLILVDPDGRWPGDYHDKIVQNVFGSVLNPRQVAVIQAAGQWVDQLDFQEPKFSFMHSMRDGKSRQSAQDVEAKASLYVEGELAAAVELQIKFEADGGTGNSDAALTMFGHALHTVTDGTSPAHARYQPWYCLVCPSAAAHGVHETTAVHSNKEQNVKARQRAHDEARRIWEVYQKILKSARYRLQEEEREEERRQREERR